MLFDWTDTAQKQRWSNFPQGLFTRDGLMWGNLSTTQQNAWLYIQLVLGPGEDGKTIQPEGLQVSTMTAEQQQLLLALIRVRVGMLKEDDAAVKMAEIQANLEETWFAWYGPTTNGEAAYYRIQGPTIFIEYSPQSMGGAAIDHIHAMFRDPTNDYGAGLLK